jgi:hypothetical protein
VVGNNVAVADTVALLRKYRAPVVNPVEWHKEAESVIASAEIEDVRLALIARLKERYGIGSGVLPHPTGEINYLIEPLLGVTATDAQRLAALKHLQALDERLSWTRRYFEERLGPIFRGPRPFTRFVDKLLRTTLSCVAIAAHAKSAELRVGESLAQRISRKAVPPRSVAVLGDDYWKQQSDAPGCMKHARN